MLERLQREDLLGKHCTVLFSGGEITINPYKTRIYETLSRVFRQMPEMPLVVFSNCFLYNQELADLLALNKDSFLQCDLDAGTPESYIKVKGFHKFDAVRENLKKYARSTTVRLKYIVLPGWNDSPEDYEGIVRFLKELGCTEMELTMEIGVSKGGDRMRLREAMYAAARLMVLMEQNGIKATLSAAYWKKEYISLVQRLYRKLRALS